ncbi:MAG TPA: cbb3-type cytochrome oxidase assembly protein CcoS [Chloroflexia bacterium]|nr:cbb3-type cytochrome oxidase assembly protein CcoS [Chloroflexia bacterium]
MRSRIKLMKVLFGVGAFLLVTAPSQAFAHDNLGGDELAAANWMLVGALVTILMGVVAGYWAIRAGQFNNVEESKYTMLDASEDFDAIMADYDRRAAAAKAASSKVKEAAAEPKQPAAERAGGAARI